MLQEGSSIPFLNSKLSHNVLYPDASLLSNHANECLPDILDFVVLVQEFDMLLDPGFGSLKSGSGIGLFAIRLR